MQLECFTVIMSSLRWARSVFMSKPRPACVVMPSVWFASCREIDQLGLFSLPTCCWTASLLTDSLREPRKASFDSVGVFCTSIKMQFYAHISLVHKGFQPCRGVCFIFIISICISSKVKEFLMIRSIWINSNSCFTKWTIQYFHRTSSCIDAGW